MQRLPQSPKLVRALPISPVAMCSLISHRFRLSVPALRLHPSTSHRRSPPCHHTTNARRRPSNLSDSRTASTVCRRFYASVTFAILEGLGSPPEGHNSSMECGRRSSRRRRLSPEQATGIVGVVVLGLILACPPVRCLFPNILNAATLSSGRSISVSLRVTLCFTLVCNHACRPWQNTNSSSIPYLDSSNEPSDPF